MTGGAPTRLNPTLPTVGSPVEPPPPTPSDDLQILRSRRRRQRRIRLLVVLVAIGIGTVFTFRNPLFRKNLGTVSPDTAYRSAQPEANLPELVDDLNLTSILNLRGGSLRDDFYAREVELTEQRGIDFYDFPMSATRRPRRHELLTLIEIFQSCRYPILIHCKSGSDRTGLASAIYLLMREQVPPQRALKSFSIYYGHVPLFGPERLHEPIREYATWLLEQGLDHTPARFQGWVERWYSAEDPPSRIEPPRKGSRWDLRKATKGASQARVGELLQRE